MLSSLQKADERKVQIMRKALVFFFHIILTEKSFETHNISGALFLIFHFCLPLDARRNDISLLCSISLSIPALEKKRVHRMN